jgi:hypothetical protein
MPRSSTDRRQFLTSAALGAAGVVAARAGIAAEIPPQSDFPQLEFVYAANVTIAPIEDVGDTFSGHQRLIPITGGFFEGPRMRGKVLPGAADWNLQRRDGVTVVSASYFMRTDDGITIKILNEGVNPAAGTPPSIRPRFTHPTFEAPEGRYAWLNQAVFVGTLKPMSKEMVLIRVFKLV